MKICFWSSSFQSDNQALAHYLAEQRDTEVVVAMAAPDAYRRTPAFRLLPFRGRLLDRTAPGVQRELAAFAPDLVVVDNHLPDARVAERMLVLWHGFGWRVDDLGSMRKQLRKQLGDVTRPNPRFVWQAFGEWDRRYRIEHSGFAAENVRALGSAYSDLLRPDSALTSGFDRSAVQDGYRIDIVRRKTVLFAPTWHHGGPLEHWGDEASLLARLFEHAETRDANLLLRLHDRHRYEPRFVADMQALCARHANVQIKWKDEAPDSLVDLLVSDVMLSNYSSLLNAWYYTEKPSVHIDPTPAPGAQRYQRRLKRGGLHKERLGSDDVQWKLGLDQIGGLRAGSFDALLGELDRALADAACCRDVARSFCARYVSDVDGHSCERITQLLRRFCAAPAGEPWI